MIVQGKKEYLYTSTLDCIWESFSGWWARVYDNGVNDGKQWSGTSMAFIQEQHLAIVYQKDTVQPLLEGGFNQVNIVFPAHFFIAVYVGVSVERHHGRWGNAGTKVV